ncbi:MAG TPA: SusE domain-containing protein [Puia sp.]|jgi:hypothetical protein|nr:SusE domain-containing protein [Puia sp.]
MKKYFNKILLALCGLILFASCKKNVAELTYSGNGTAPVLSATVASSDSIPLSPADSTNTAITFSWTNPDYSFSNGISSLNVNYNLQIDTAGANFTSSKMIQIGIASDLSKTFSVADLNFVLFGTMQLQTGVQHNIEVRIESFLNEASLPLYSNTLSYTVTPYAIPPQVNPPTTGTLFITGSATPDSWMVGGDATSVTTPVNQQLTVVPGSNGLIYTITMQMIGGQQFLLVPAAGDWTNKYATADGTGGTTSGGTFSYNAANNFTGPSSSGTYTVTFNFQTGTYSITQ